MTRKMQNYSAEFKAEAVKKTADNNGNLSATARQVEITMQTLSSWQDKVSEGKLKSTKEYDPQLMAIIEKNKCSNWGLKVAKG